MSKFEDRLIKVMENTVESIIGEDGLTVWDFAELRDAILSAHQLELREIVGEIEEEQSNHNMGNKLYYEMGLREAISIIKRRIKNPNDLKKE